MPNPATIAIFSLASLSIGLIVGQYFGKKQEQKNQKNKYRDSFKGMIESYMALNITHLHDAANLFNLIKLNSTESEIKSFATGSAFHFRSIFNSLKNSLETIRDYDPDEVNNPTLFKLIEKEEVNLKDLIEVELFQLGNFSKIVVEDSVPGHYAFTLGNFELLSKVLLNLLENGLKYSKKAIKVYLIEEDNNYIIRIMSFGDSISEEISRKINNKVYDNIDGHGLSSLVDIMNYHDAAIFINSLPNEGSCISLEFKKFQPANNFAKEVRKDIAELEKKESKLNIPKLPIKQLSALSLILCAGFFTYQFFPRTNSINEVNQELIQEEVEVVAQTQTTELNYPLPQKKAQVAIKPKAAKSEQQYLSALIDQETEGLGLDMEL